MKSLLLIGDFDIPADYLQSFRVTHCSTAKAKRLDAGFIQKLNHAQAIIYRTACPFMPEVLIQAPKLRYIVKAGSGLGGVDLEYCRRRNIKVANVAGANSRSVVELALWQALSLARFSCLFGNQPDMLGEELASKSAVVYGFGHIGRQLGQLLEAFGMTVTACGRESSAA